MTSARVPALSPPLTLFQPRMCRVRARKWGNKGTGMDSLRGFDDEAYAVHEDETAMEAPPEIGVDERRMHVRAYNHWVSLLDGRPYPSIEDLRPERIGDFGPHSVILDFSQDEEDPELPFA